VLQCKDALPQAIVETEQTKSNPQSRPISWPRAVKFLSPQTAYRRSGEMPAQLDELCLFDGAQIASKVPEKTDHRYRSAMSARCPMALATRLTGGGRRYEKRASKVLERARLTILTPRKPIRRHPCLCRTVLRSGLEGEAPGHLLPDPKVRKLPSSDNRRLRHGQPDTKSASALLPLLRNSYAIEPRRTLFSGYNDKGVRMSAV
jgi:hypothetical protein